jgi:catechol 2,3-dioxygenase-like lactoylglutathione lyase family enzyme
MRALTSAPPKGDRMNDEQYKDMARRLRKDLTDSGVVVSHSQALEIVAHQHGARDWNTLVGGVGKASPAPSRFDRVAGADAVQVHEIVPFLHPVSMARSLAFYRDLLGFRIALAWPSPADVRWCRLEHGHAALMLQEPGDVHGRSPRIPLGQGLSLNFTCSNALAVYDAVIGSGVVVEEPMVSNHMWVVALLDPDGCRIEFHSSTLDPEESTLSQVRRSAG